MSKLSFIFPYRDRKRHLELVIPAIQKAMETQKISYEIIVAEQSDTKPFRRANLLNEGAKYAAKDSDIFVLHDADHLPSTSSVYYDGISDVFLPIKRVEFVIQDNDNSIISRQFSDIPAGYRHFKDGVDENYYGGVLSIKVKEFFRINGFSSLFRGWGVEEADLRHRIAHYDLNVQRGNGLFYALDHADSCPPMYDPDFQNNMRLGEHSTEYLDYGVNNQPSSVKDVPPKIPGVTRWIECTSFDPPIQGSEKIVSSNINFEDMDE